MSKYDFELDLSLNSSTGMILNQIPRGAVILEFGCATGRMTRYMKEELDCQVYIVEYNQEAYKTALQYAECGLCGDIMQFHWVEQFQNIAFDAIIFADVLEHLTAPEEVLKQAAGLLKATGKIYVSLPNITHNDILLKLYDSRFDYTSTGILDDTHVHFWGLENLKQLSGKNGLYVNSIKGTRCPTGSTEQFSPEDTRTSTEPDLLLNLLQERQCGEVYQFVAVLSKEKMEIDCRLPQPVVKSHIYLDTGHDFNAEEMQETDAIYSGHGSYTVQYTIEQTDNVSRLKFDPVEYQSCILKYITIRQGNVELPLMYANGISLQEGLLLTGTDPTVYVNLEYPGQPVTIDTEFVLPGPQYLAILQEACSMQHKQMEELKQLKQQETLWKQKAADISARQQAAFQKEKDSLNRLIAELQQDVNAYVVLVNNKDMCAVQLEKRIEQLEQQVGYYQNMKVIKLRTLMARIWRGVKRRLKRFLKR